MNTYTEAFSISATRMPSAWAVQSGDQPVCLTDNAPEARALARRLYAFQSQNAFLGELPRTTAGLAAFLSSRSY